MFLCTLFLLYYVYLSAGIVLQHNLGHQVQRTLPISVCIRLILQGSISTSLERLWLSVTIWGRAQN